jgi:ADP-heptose:LPS heptosyltransferase
MKPDQHEGSLQSGMHPRNCFVFKPDGIGDLFLASGAIRLLARECGEENLSIAVLPIMESVVRGQFPKATVILLPMRAKRLVLNLFVANALRCFVPWLGLLRRQVDVSISLRNMRNYLQTFLFCSVRSPKRILCANLLLGNGRPVRRWTERAFEGLFHLRIIAYPESVPDIPKELEAHRILVGEALGREVAVEEIWPLLRPVGQPTLKGNFWVCAPFSSALEKDFPTERWCLLFQELQRRGKLPRLVLTGSKDQGGRLEDFRDLLAATCGEIGSKTEILLPETLQDFIDLLAAAECVLTVDTAAAHAATALDCRTLVLFSGQHQGMFAPWTRSRRQHWLLPKPSSTPARWHDSHESEELLHCIEGLFTALQGFERGS